MLVMYDIYNETVNFLLSFPYEKWEGSASEEIEASLLEFLLIDIENEAKEYGVTEKELLKEWKDACYSVARTITENK